MRRDRALQPDPHANTDPLVRMAACTSSTGEALVGVCATDAVRRTTATLAHKVMGGA